jgi:hypothetical protein
MDKQNHKSLLTEILILNSMVIRHNTYFGFLPQINNDKSISAEGTRCNKNLEILIIQRFAVNTQHIYHIDCNGGTS